MAAAAATSCSSLLLLLASLSAFFFSHAAALHTFAGAGARTIDATTAASDGGDDAKVYIVFTERLPVTAASSEHDTSAAIASYHHDLLGTVLDGSSSAPERVVYHYSRGLHGFAARLTRDERNKLAEKEAVLSIHEKVVYWPQTTRSWDFLGLPLPPKHKDALPFENDVIIGMVDSGVWPESDSFSDDGLPPPPAKWKGVCSNFTCNNKIIGARAYLGGRTTLSPRDDDGHGTHTASTAAGRVVPGASLGGLARGTARGGAPGARLAVYKVCWGKTGCSSDDILAAFDDAIADGVDVLSASLGSSFAFDYSDDTIAIAAFHAMRRGVVTSVAAGNDGPDLGSVSNVAPWMVVSAAVTDDRKIVSQLVLGDGTRVVGNASINAFFPHLGKPAMLVDPGGCTEEDLKGKRFKGAILLCGYDMDSEAFRATGAYGAIRHSFMLDFSDGNSADFSFAHPTILLNGENYDRIVDYYNTTTRNPMGIVRSSMTIKDTSSPSVASFSSRGPNRITHGVLKPDISAPGVSILAAWSEEASVSGMDMVDKRRTKYNIISGTSMACPHVTAAAALVKSIHPSWSHAAVLSALVTTATPMTSSSAAAPEAELAYGAGLVNPLCARYPGLVYDASTADYVALLCSQGYNESQLATITGSAKHAAAACRPAKGAGHVAVGGLKYPSIRGAAGDLNYPSMAVPVLNYGLPFAVEFPRTVTNVGPADSVYRATVTSVPGVDITVTPDELAFSADTKKLSFTVRVYGVLVPVNGSHGASASVVWSDGRHKVRSPVHVFPYKHMI